MATRCFCPPESSEGRAPPRSPSPTRSSQRFASPRGHVGRHAAHQARRERHVLEHREVRKELKILKDDAHRATQVAGSVSGAVRAGSKLEAGDRVIVPESKRSRPFKQRSNVVLPHPDGPTIATTSPSSMRASTLSSTRRDPNDLAKLWMAIMGKPLFEVPRVARKREAHREVEGGAGETWHDPVAQIDRRDGHALGELDHGQHADERGILQERDEVVGHRGQRRAKRLGKST